MPLPSHNGKSISTDNHELKTGVLLTNIGSPEAATPKALRKYLAEFLSDARIIDWPRAVWLPILHGIVLRTRPRRSAKLYEHIWTEDGSPLLKIVREQGSLLQKKVGDSFVVRIGMRYGEPSIAYALRELRREGVDRILVFPLFPQYSQTTTASTFDAVFDELKTWDYLPEINTIASYHDHPDYLKALKDSVVQARERWGRPDRLLISYHGVPKRYDHGDDPYVDQCQFTAEKLADSLGLEPHEWQVCFQSRFGPEEWLQPYTDETLEAWGQEGIEHVQVICPGFSADCLETIDEMDREGRHSFLQAGGKEFHYIPALNDSLDHIEVLLDVIKSATSNLTTGSPATKRERRTV